MRTRFMSWARCRVVAVIGGAVFALAAFMVPQQVEAGVAPSGCGGAIGISTLPDTSPPNELIDLALPTIVQVTLTPAAATGTNDITTDQVRYALACANTGSGADDEVPCTFGNDDDGGGSVPITYAGNLGGSCGASATVPGANGVGTVDFDFGPTALGESGCTITFDVSVNAAGTDTTPLVLTGATEFDGTCSAGALDGGANGSVPIFIEEATCDFVVDKRVSCALGEPVDVSGSDDGDPPDSTQSCDGWSAFLGSPAEPLDVTYFAKSTGGLDLINCSLTDDNSALGIDQAVDDFPFDQTDFGAVESSMTAVAFNGVCSDSLDDQEPNTATLTCDCALPGETTPVVTNVSRTDTAAFACLTPGLQITKTCDEQVAGDPPTNAVNIMASSTGDAGLEGCVLVDEVYEGPCDEGTGDPTGPLLTTLINESVGLPLNRDESVEGLTADACNVVTITCDVTGSGDPLKPISATDSDTCEVTVEECLTHTPGFWGTHPDVTTLFLPVTVCGTPIDNTVAGNDHSSAEAMCVSGGEAARLGSSPQYTSLVRALTAAKLSIAATTEGGGSCGDFEYETDLGTEILNINTVIAECEALCFADADAIEQSSCIEKLAAFNESEDTLDPFGPFINPGPADPTECKAAKNNGIIVAGDPNFCAATGGDAGNCFDDTHGTGCSDPAIEADVCAGDSFCCDTDWDGLCVDEAMTFCAS